ncbi:MULTISPECIES: carboxymuconolactone decarboxylase family protein [Rhodococcus]|uniref:Carboxymuconolactone decarboxylase family protein n=2 Tax=Rhodococcus opacus TaxID=37919 RepID=A0AAX3YAS8_RHOOP|nr:MULTISPECIES: carboxymuconolactone decarboxylase family protein [Rhodococcus]NDV04232.1 4-carboxymuconolactone decarboxylase [Rhodococcus sp. IEGM 248]EID79347.1 4-carboxymuconolactone decarboxylase [Rhodococcus opacus RKJ300 = JCM 13270]MCZ4584581.1 carboxymuconolactone decarboxylase family protein [Rhodococcus opacus]MDV7083634.1 carboxymuconolactone decarboxylase family protein [Rhodococcus opacus]QDQ94790.1 4-carboxymuconolactone decarboxylase [Rhodococcus sp. WB9]
MTSEEPGKRSPAVEAGLTVRREVMGPDFVERALTRTAGTDSEQLQEFVTEHVWDAVWNRPGLDRRSRSLLNLGMLIALRAHGELKGHVRGALRNGLTRTEVVEAVIHASAYCGAPAGLSAMAVVQEALDAELGPLETED